MSDAIVQIYGFLSAESNPETETEHQVMGILEGAEPVAYQHENFI
jgi:hypothetical protein